MQTVTKIITSSSMTTEESSEVVETVTEESSVQKKERVKSKKAKRGKENISVVSEVVSGWLEEGAHIGESVTGTERRGLSMQIIIQRAICVAT